MVTAALSVTRAGWSDAAAVRLAAIAGHDAADMAAFEAHVASGAMMLGEIHLRGDLVGVVIWSVCDEPARRVVVINAAACDPVRGVDMTETLFAFGRAMGERHGATILRFWTQRAGLVRKLQKRMARTYVMEAQIGQQ